MAPSERPASKPSPAPRGHAISRGRKIFAAAITFTIVPLVGFLALEMIFVLFVPVTDVAWTFWDPLTGIRRHPDQAGRYIKDAIDAPYRFNAQGWNHPEDYVLAKPEGTVRVCMVGDSMVEAKQVDPNLSMILKAQELMTRPERPAQWYGFGMAGWGTTQEHQAIRHYVLDYAPDLVVLMFVQNDPADCSPYITKIERYEPKFTLAPDGSLTQELPRYKPPAWRGRLAFKSSLIRYFFAQKGVWARLGGATRQGIGDVPLREGAGDVSEEESGPRAAGRLEREEKTWRLLEAILAATRDEVRRRGATFAIVFRGHYKELDQAAEGGSYAAPPKEADPYCLHQRLDEMGREFVEPMARRLGIPYLDLTGPLMELVTRTHVSFRFPDDNHYNAAAHEVVGRELAAWAESLLAERAVPVPAPPAAEDGI